MAEPFKHPLDAPAIARLRKSLPRQRVRRFTFRARLQEISARYPGETRKQRRYIARQAMKHDWKEAYDINYKEMDRQAREIEDLRYP